MLGSNVSLQCSIWAHSRPCHWFAFAWTDVNSELTISLITQLSLWRCSWMVFPSAFPDPLPQKRRAKPKRTRCWSVGLRRRPNWASMAEAEAVEVTLISRRRMWMSTSWRCIPEKEVDSSPMEHSWEVRNWWEIDEHHSNAKHTVCFFSFVKFYDVITQKVVEIIDFRKMSLEGIVDAFYDM